MLNDLGRRLWVITGAGGMLGRDLVAALRAKGEQVRPYARTDLDVTDRRAVDVGVADAAASGDTVVVNLAAWTDVDGAEAHEDAARAVNVGGATNVARACARNRTLMIHLSTDYVFDGAAKGPYSEDAPRAPVSAYGRTKATSELAVIGILPSSGVVLRTAWLYGEHGQSFVRTMAKLAAEREFVDVVNDQIGQPTWTVDLAERIIEVGLKSRAAGVFHATNSGSTTWFGLAQAVFAILGLDPERVRPTTSDRFPRPAARPGYSVLGHDRWVELGLAPMRPWRDALSAATPIMLRTD